MTHPFEILSSILATTNPLQLGYLIALLGVFFVLFVSSWRRIPSPEPVNTLDGNKDSIGVSVAKADTAAVPDAAIATNFQLLSVFPNVTFGIQGLIAIPLINVIAFFLGNALTSMLLKPLLSAVRSHGTLHQYIAATHLAPSLRRFTALISLSVFISVTCFELLYLSRISRSLIGSPDDNTWFVLFGFLVVSLIVIAHVGQQRSELLFDKWLLLIAYVGVHAAIALMVVHAQPKLDISTVSVIVLLGVMLWYRTRQLFVSRQSGRWRHAAIVLSTLGLLLALVHFFLFRVHFSVSGLKGSFSALTPSACGMSGLVFAMAAAASILPVIFYNFVDFSFWQKYQSEVFSDETDDVRAKRLSKSFRMYVLESPLSWLLPVILGLYAVDAISNDDASTRPIPAIADYLSHTSSFGPFVGIIFYAGLVAVAVSTACGYLVSTSYLYKMDISKSASEQNSNPVPLSIIGLLLLGMLLPIDMISKSIDQIIGLMLTFFAPLCALTPLVMYPLIARKSTVNLTRPALRAMIVGIATSSILGLGIGVFAAIRGADPSMLIFWLPMPFSFVTSWIVYLIMVLFGTAKPTPMRGIA